MRDFGEILRTVGRDHRDRVAVTCEGQDQTYGQLFARACRLANALAGLGAKPGDRVALVGPNSAQTVEQISGIALGGFVRAGLYAHVSPEVNAYLVEHLDAPVMIAHATLAPGLLERRHEMPRLSEVVVYGGEVPDGALDYEALIAAAPETDPEVHQAPDDLHVVRFSAGTTGLPKGIVHTVARWLRSQDEYRWVTPQLDERDVYLAIGQLTHAAVVWLWPVLMAGGRIVVVPAFDPGATLELIERERVTVTLGVPTMMQALVAHPDATRRDLSSLRCFNYAAAPISETTVRRAQAVLGHDVLYQLYAQSEAWPITMLLPHQHDARPRSVGRPTPNTVVTVIDEDGLPVAPGEVGEIAVRSDGLMQELWKDPEGTAARTLADGSRLTRDMGYLDEEGFLFLADRKEDMIVSGGFNIWPAELENAIAAHPAVAEVCVVGAPHEKWGETPVAVVVAAAGESVDPNDVIAFCRDRVGSVHKVTAVEVVDDLPKSGVGKVLRKQVREPYWAGREDRLGGV